MITASAEVAASSALETRRPRPSFRRDPRPSCRCRSQPQGRRVATHGRPTRGSRPSSPAPTSAITGLATRIRLLSALVIEQHRHKPRDALRADERSACDHSRSRIPADADTPAARSRRLCAVTKATQGAPTRPTRSFSSSPDATICAVNEVPAVVTRISVCSSTSPPSALHAL